MTQKRKLTFTGFTARIQYFLLMGLFRVAITRGLYGGFARGLGRVFGPRNAASLSLGNAPPFKIYLNDGYWTRFALYRDDYEPEVARIMAAAGKSTGLFCDLGANKGYWTVQASSLFQHVCAVEASQQTFEALQENAAHLPNVTLHKAAIHKTSGQSLSFINIPLSHASARLADSTDGDAPSEIVETRAIDDLIPPGTAALIKLDVEGAEIAAFDGAARTLQDGSVFIYEDHGNDPDCRPSAHLLGQANISLYSCEKGLIPLETVADIRALKTDPYKGYNFIAAHSASPLLQAIREDFANRAG